MHKGWVHDELLARRQNAPPGAPADEAWRRPDPAHPAAGKQRLRPRHQPWSYLESGHYSRPPTSSTTGRSSSGYRSCSAAGSQDNRSLQSSRTATSIRSRSSGAQSYCSSGSATRLPGDQWPRADPVRHLAAAIPGYTGFVPKRQAGDTLIGERFHTVKQAAAEAVGSRMKRNSSAPALAWQYRTDSSLPCPPSARREGKLVDGALPRAPWERHEAVLGGDYPLGSAERCAVRRAVKNQQRAALQRNLPAWSNAAG
eukprot:TRINITY_DN15559_c0_g1_i1.p1 TRINITY_DN15559_c0_g1~~TRINITY_DN15559_c0_g1_i1.p1  ORF type:complete len:256 (+),score=30.33 TRINITY_DN15559_c0_g1_i1:212-979(+)